MKTLTDLMIEYLADLRSLKYSLRTLRRYRDILRVFVRWLAEHPGIETADRIQSEHLRQWHKALSVRSTLDGRPLKSTTINRHLTAVRGWLKYLGRYDYVNKTLIEHLPYVREPQRLPVNVLTHAQMRRLLAKAPSDTNSGVRNRAMLELLYSTGVRVSELLGLNVDSVDFTYQTMQVRGKGDKDRVVPIGRTALRHLNSYIIAARPYLLKVRHEQALFLNPQGPRLSYFAFLCIVHAAAQRAGLAMHVSPHTFRRSCTTELIRSGANMYHVKELLGHESLDTLKRYAKVTIIDLKKTHEKCHPRERDNRC